MVFAMEIAKIVSYGIAIAAASYFGWKGLIALFLVALALHVAYRVKFGYWLGND